VVIATDDCRVTGRHIFSGAEVVGKNLKYGVSVHCHAHHLASACYFPAADLYSMVYEIAL